MAFKLTDKESKRRDEYIDGLRERRRLLDDKLAELNQYVSAYNEYLMEASGFCEDIANEREQEYDDRSERWQESDKGNAAHEWFNEWHNHYLEEVEPVELDMSDDAEKLEQLPDEASE